MRPKHPRGCITTLAPLKEALRNKRSGKFPSYFLAPFNLDNYWWGPPGSRPDAKPGAIHKLTFDEHSFCGGSTLCQIRLSDFYMDLIRFNAASGPPRVISASRGWFYHEHYNKNFPPVYLFENYWFAYAYVTQLGVDHD